MEAGKIVKYKRLFIIFLIKLYLIIYTTIFIGDYSRTMGIGDWAQSPIPNPQYKKLTNFEI